MGKHVFVILILTFVSLYAHCNENKCNLKTPASVVEKQKCLSQLSIKYQKAEIAGDLKEAKRVIVEEVEPFIKAKTSTAIRTEELLMNFSRIKESLNIRINKSSHKK